MAGQVHKPGVDREGGLSHDIFYVPQKPYVMPGSLREQLVYPLPVDGAVGERALGILCVGGLAWHAWRCWW